MNNTQLPIGFDRGIQWSYITTIPKNDRGGEDRCCYGRIGGYGSIAIFDGHSGSGAATWLEANSMGLFDQLVKITPDEFENTVADGFIKCQDLFQNAQPKDRSGSTVLLVTQDNNTMYSAWIGDSEGYLFSMDGKFKSVTPVSHNITNEKERETIKQLIGENDDRCVLLGSVLDFIEPIDKFQYWISSNSNKLTVVPSKKLFPDASDVSISVSRSIGDDRFDLVLSPIPDTMQTTIDDNYILVCATDGLWLMIQPDDINNLILEFVSERDFDINSEKCVKNLLCHVCKTAAQIVLDRYGDDARDDITIVVSWISPQIKTVCPYLEPITLNINYTHLECRKKSHKNCIIC